MGLRARLGVVLPALAAAVALADAARAFVVEAGPEPAASPIEDLRRAARWDANPGALVRTGERGLGGGLEYSVDPSVCTKLRFADAADCAAIKAQIAEAARRWTAGHPHLRFVDVSKDIPAELAPETEGWRGFGAEIDFVAVEARDFRAFHKEEVAADARTYYVHAPRPRRLDAARSEEARGAITSVDIRLNASVCFYLDPSARRDGCMHFGSVVMHELAHALGLDHPDENPSRNLDLDANPSGPMALDCREAAKGLKVSPVVERFAVANGRWTGAGYWTRGLTYDDLAGRDALYPACDIAPVVAAAGGPRRWGAFARGGDGGYGWSRGYVSEEGARKRALAECAERSASGGCAVQAAFVDCFAYARARDGAWGWSVRAELDYARSSAAANCARHAETCRPIEAFCAAE